MSEHEHTWFLEADGEELIPPDGDLGLMLSNFVAADKEYRLLEEQLEAAKKKLAAMEDPLAEQMGLMGMQSARVDGMTIYIKRTPYVSKAAGVETESVCEILKHVGLEYMVSEGYNAQSLKSKVKEYQEKWRDLDDDYRESHAEEYTDTGVPRELAKLLSIGERISVETRRR